MAHFAELNSDNEVTRVVVIDNADTSDSDGNEVESIGVAFCQSLYGSDTNWKQASYNHSMRVRFAGPGFKYDETLDAFIPPKPFPSWVLNTETKNWESPAGPKPSLTTEEAAVGSPYEFGEYSWEEDSTSWVMYYPVDQEDGTCVWTKRTS